jgi:hypothetical protein
MGSYPNSPPPLDLDILLDPSHPTYGLVADDWEAPPTFIAPEWVESSISYQRLGNADAYQQHGCPTAWHRYVTLGFYVFDDCTYFKRYWRQFATKGLLCSQIVWYNYMYIADQRLDLYPKLHALAQEVARPYLAEHDRGFLTINTTRMSWNTAISTSILNMDDEPFTQVGPKKRDKKRKSAMKSSPPSTHVGPLLANAMSKDPTSALSKFLSCLL